MKPAHSDSAPRSVDCCPLCNSQERSLEFVGRDIEYEVEGTFPIYRCQSCNLAYLGNVPTRTNLRSYYPEGYSAYEPGDSRFAGVFCALQALVMGVAPKVYFGVPVEPPPTAEDVALDLGSGSGLLDRRLREAGWRVIGLDFTRQPFAYQIGAGLDLVVGDAARPPFKDGHFALVVASHSIEHLPDPVEALKEVWRIVAPGGRIVAVVPNYDSACIRLLGPACYADLSIPRHLVHFNEATLVRSFNDVGFRDIQIHNVPYARFGRYLLVKAGMPAAKVRKSALGSIAAITFLAIDLAFAIRRRGSGLLVTAKKPPPDNGPSSGT